MGINTKALRHRIKSVDSTLHLTKAMGLVASSKIRRALDSMNQGKEYLKAVNRIIELLITLPECKKSPYMQKRDGDRMKLIVIAGDRGLAGGYNANVFRIAKEFPNAQIIPIGNRACDRYGETGNSSEYFSYTEAYVLAEKLCKAFTSGEFDKLGIIGTKYVSLLSQKAQITWLLPLNSADEKTSVSTVFEPDELLILKAAVPEYLSGIIFAAVRESFACEIVARRTAMDSASKNAQEMIERLLLEYNRARQGAITQEITEIVAGSDE